MYILEYLFSIEFTTGTLLA